MSEKHIHELAVQYLQNIGTLEEIRSYSIREMDNFLLNVKHECSRKNILRVQGNFKIDLFTEDPDTPNKRGLLTSDYAILRTQIKYKKNNRYTRVAYLFLMLCSGSQFGIPPSRFHWIIASKTTSKWGYDFDETLVEQARKDPTSRFYNKIKSIDEDTVLYHVEPVSEKLTVETATNDVIAVAKFIYSTGEIFAEKWKDEKILETKPVIAETTTEFNLYSNVEPVNKSSQSEDAPIPSI